MDTQEDSDNRRRRDFFAVIGISQPLDSVKCILEAQNQGGSAIRFWEGQNGKVNFTPWLLPMFCFEVEVFLLGCFLR